MKLLEFKVIVGGKDTPVMEVSVIAKTEGDALRQLQALLESCNSPLQIIGISTSRQVASA